jgi:hypothetical protein
MGCFGLDIDDAILTSNVFISCLFPPPSTEALLPDEFTSVSSSVQPGYYSHFICTVGEKAGYNILALLTYMSCEGVTCNFLRVLCSHRVQRTTSLPAATFAIVEWHGQLPDKRDESCDGAAVKIFSCPFPRFGASMRAGLGRYRRKTSSGTR